MACKEKKIRISLVIAHALLRKGLSLLLKDLSYSLLSSHDNGKAMIASFSTNSLPGVVLVDADHEEAAALEIVRWLSEHHPCVKILAFTLEAEEALIKPLLDNGAHGFLRKTSEPLEIKRAIERVFDKGAYFPPPDPWRLKHC